MNPPFRLPVLEKFLLGLLAFPFLVVPGRTETTEDRLQESIALLQRLDVNHRPEELTEDQMNALSDLGASEWQVREQATEVLQQSGPDVLRRLRALQENSDPEIAMRAKRIVKAVEAKESRLVVGSKADLVERHALLLARNGNTEVPKYLLPLLAHSEMEVQFAASKVLQRFTRLEPPELPDPKFDPDDSLVWKFWHSWWEEAEGDWRYDEDLETVVLVCDPSRNQVLAVDLDGEVLWTRTFRLPPMVAELTAEGSIRVAYRGTGIIEEISPQGRVLWRCDGKEEIQGIADLQQLADGRLLITDDPGGQVLEINRKGEILWRITDLEAPHAAWRTSKGETFVAVHKDSSVVSVSPEEEITHRWEDFASISDLRPADESETSWMITRMGEKPNVIRTELDGEETELYSSGWPVTSGLITKEGVVFSANERSGVVSGPLRGSIRQTGISRGHMWGKLRQTTKGRARLATPQ